MIKVKYIERFSYARYNSVLMLKLLEVTLKEFFKFQFFSSTIQKKRFFWERAGLFSVAQKKKTQSECIWVHANAIGEVLASEKLLELIKNRYPSKRILLTTSNLSADAEAQQVKTADSKFFFTNEITFIIKKFLKVFDPVVIIIIESDVWPNFLRLCKEARIPVLLASGMFMDNYGRSVNTRYLYNYRFRLSGAVLSCIDCFCMQSNEDRRMISLKIPGHAHVNVTGNLKFRRVNKSFSAQEKLKYANIFNITGQALIFVAGNVHKEEGATVIEAIRLTKETLPGMVSVLAPRFMEDIPIIESILKRSGLRYVRRSHLGSKKREDEDVILLDTMGELAKIYSIANVSFVGGSLVYLGNVFGGHNILEPAQYGVPVIFGPYMHNFRELADTFLQKQIAVQVNDSKTLKDNIVDLSLDKNKRELIENNAQEIFRENEEVAEKTFLSLRPFLDKACSLLKSENKCEVCSKKEFKFLIRQGKYDIFQCNSCGLVFSDPLPSDAELSEFYQHFSFNEFEDKYTTENEKIAEYVTREQVALLRRMGEDIRGGGLLDIGCGNGYYLYGAKTYGFEVFGVEKDKSAAQIASSRYGVKILSRDLDECDFPDEYFDIIKMRQCIEHLSHPNNYLQEVNRILKKGGVLIIETVNTKSLETIPRLYFLDAIKKITAYMPEIGLTKKIILSLRRRWGFTDPPRHLYGFSAKNLRLLVSKRDFVCLKVIIAAMGNKIYYPLSKGHRNFLHQAEIAAIDRLYARSFFAYLLYQALFKPAMAIFWVFIRLFGLGSHLVIYAKKL